MTKKLSWNLANRLIADNTEEVVSSSLVRDPVVTVSVVTFNQVKYIAQALDSVLEQETQFPFEIVIGDDCSTDGTGAIVREYQKAHPNKIVLLSSTQRLGEYTGNGRLNFIRNLKFARGRYIALLEGDDYWCDKTKLQQQVQALESDSSLSGSFHDTSRLRGSHFNDPATYNPGHVHFQDRVVQRQLIGDKCPFHTSSFVFRRGSVKELLVDILNLQMLDFPLFVRASRDGSLNKIHTTMSVYRQDAGGVTTQPLYMSKSRFVGTEREVERLALWLSLTRDIHPHNRDKLSEVIAHHSDNVITMVNSLQRMHLVRKVYYRVFSMRKATLLLTSLCCRKLSRMVIHRAKGLARRLRLRSTSSSP